MPNSLQRTRVVHGQLFDAQQERHYVIGCILFSIFIMAVPLYDYINIGLDTVQNK